MLWIHYHGVDDMYAWAELNGLPKKDWMIVSGSISVEQTEQGALLFLEAVPLKNNVPQLDANGDFIRQGMMLPYVESIPEGIGKLVDWELKLPAKQTTPPMLEDLDV